jgi:hypothetical protein
MSLLSSLLTVQCRRHTVASTSRRWTATVRDDERSSFSSLGQTQGKENSLRKLNDRLSPGAMIASARAIAQFAASLPRWTNGATNQTAATAGGGTGTGTPVLRNASWSQALEKPECGACKTTDWPAAWCESFFNLAASVAQHVN